MRGSRDEGTVGVLQFGVPSVFIVVSIFPAAGLYGLGVVPTFFLGWLGTVLLRCVSEPILLDCLTLTDLPVYLALVVAIPLVLCVFPGKLGRQRF